MPNLKLLATITLLGLTLTACGQKGDLYLPKDGENSVASPSPMPTDTANEPTVTGDAQNPNIIVTEPTEPQTTAHPKQGNVNDY